MLAKELGISQAAVHKRRRKAIGRLKERMGF
jgi:predicted DNA binding protein